jgi:DNA-binding Xre family transcriptional regulator
MSQNRRSRGVQATVAGVESLEAKRVGKNWTRQALANRAGVSLDTLERLIRREKVDRDSVRKIVSALNLQPAEIIDGDEWEVYPVFHNPAKRSLKRAF